MVEEEDDDNLRDGAFIVESLRSFMCKHYGIYHPFQKITDNVFEEDLSDEGNLKIVDSICLELKDEQSEE